VPEGKGDKLTKKIAVLAVLLYIAGTVSGQDFTFRGLPWGASIEDIIAKEGQPDSIRTIASFPQGSGYDDIIGYCYNIYIAGYKSILTYCVTKKEGLYTADYSIEEWQKETNNYNDVKNELVNLLTNLYGSPIITTSDAISINKYIWNKNGTMIELSMSSWPWPISAEKVYFSIGYTAPFAGGNIFRGL